MKLNYVELFINVFDFHFISSCSYGSAYLLNSSLACWRDNFLCVAKEKYPKGRSRTSMCFTAFVHPAHQRRPKSFPSRTSLLCARQQFSSTKYRKSIFAQRSCPKGESHFLVPKLQLGNAYITTLYKHQAIPSFRYNPAHSNNANVPVGRHNHVLQDFDEYN